LSQWVTTFCIFDKIMSMRDNTRGSGSIARLTTLLVATCGLVSLELSVHSYYVPLEPQTAKFAFENWSVVFIVLEAIAAATLGCLQKGIYMPFLLRSKVSILDKRQKQARQRIYTQTYLVAIICFAIAVIGVASYPKLPGSIIGALVPVRAAWVGVIFLVSLPSIFAAWTKDS
jgi:hypothetical protein